VIVGTAKISHCTRATELRGHWRWHLTGVKRLKRPRKHKNYPQPSWFESSQHPAMKGIHCFNGAFYREAAGVPFPGIPITEEEQR
jgi:hypothetical protein